MMQVNRLALLLEQVHPLAEYDAYVVYAERVYGTDAFLVQARLGLHHHLVRRC